MSTMTPDILMGSDGDLPAFTRHVRGVEITEQRIRVRLETHRGDWPLDTRAGISWTRYLGQKPPDLAALAAEIALEVAATPGVSSIEDLSWTQEGEAASIQLYARLATGERVPVSVTPPGRAGNLSIVVGGVLGHAGAVVP